MKNKEKKVEEPSVTKVTNLCNEPSSEELTKFYTVEQVKQELESFVKEKGFNCQFYDNGGGDDDASPLWCLGVKIEIGERVRWVTFQFTLFPMTEGCFGYQLTIMKMILERISRADIPLYDKCRNILFDSMSNSLTMDFYQTENITSECIRLKIDCSWNECGLGLWLSAYKIQCGGFAADDDISSVLYAHNKKLTLLERVYITALEDIENSYNCWKNGQFISSEVKKPNLDPKVRALFQPSSTHNKLALQHTPNALSVLCNFTWRAGLTTNFAVTAALAEVLQSDEVKVLDSFHFPDFNAYYVCNWPEITPPIVMAISFTVNGRKFVYHRNTNSDEFCIDEIGTGNKLVMMESFNNTNVGKIRSAICRFLGIQL